MFGNSKRRAARGRQHLGPASHLDQSAGVVIRMMRKCVNMWFLYKAQRRGSSVALHGRGALVLHARKQPGQSAFDDLGDRRFALCHEGQRAAHFDGRDADAGGQRAVDHPFAKAARDAA